MAHPLKADASSAHNAKMRKMTKDYGSASGAQNNIASPQSKYKVEGAEENVGFGADSSKASARSDRPARRTTAANPIATYATGGAVKAKSAGGVIARARGGRTKGATHVNVIVAPQTAPTPNTPPPDLAKLAAQAAPPPPPMGPPPGGPPPMPPQGGPPMPMRAKGGRISKMDDEDGGLSDKLINDVLSEEGMRKRAKGGGVHMTAGAATGIGRLEKMGIGARSRGSMKPKDV